MRLLVNVPLCPLYAAPDAQAERADEALLGWPLEVLERVDTVWCRVRTHYRYEGYVRCPELAPDTGWEDRPLLAVRGSFADLLAAPAVEAPVQTTLPRGSLAAPLEGGSDGWQRIALPDGREGYTKRSLLAPYYKKAPSIPQAELRRRVVESACSYLGTQYRWGGKSPLGIDCSGLTFMAWFLNGVCLYRDAKLVDGFPARPIPYEARQPGDLLYFPGHIALYLGEDRYIHSTARTGSDGVVVNSLDPAASDYRADLRESMLAVGSVFPLA